MRKILLLLLIIVNLFQIDVKPVEAACGCRCNPGICPGDAVIDVANLVQNIKANIQEVLVNIRRTNIDASQASIQINTFKTMYDETIKRPLNDAMSLLAINTSADQIINLVNGSTDGNSLLVANPEKFIMNAGLQAMQKNYNLLTETAGVYSDEAVDAIIEEAKDEDDDAQLSSLTQSSLPATIQNDLCSDAGLTAGAENNLANQGVGSPTVGQVSTEKQNIYSQYCTKDPDSDVAFAKSLVALNARDSSAGGWDAWLLKTSGDNEFTRVSQALDIVEQKKKEAEDSAEDDIDSGEGVQSEKECIKRDSTGLCTETIIINPGSALRDAYSKAKTAPLDTAVKSLGTGADGSGLFDDLSDIMSFAGTAYQNVGYVSTLFGSLTGSSAGDTTLNTSRTPTINTLNTPTATTSPGTQTYSEEVLGQAQKDAILASVKPTIIDHLNSFSSLITSDNNYIATIDSYLNQANSLKQCFDNIESYARTNNYIPPYTLASYDVPITYYSYTDEYGTYYPPPNYDQPAAGSSLPWYTGEINITTTLRNSILNEINISIPNSRNVLNSILSRMDSARTLSEIIIIFNDYQNLLDSQNMVSLGASAIRDGENTIFQYELSQKMETSSTHYYNEYGIYNRYKDRCNYITSRVYAEIYARDNPVIDYGGGG